jgi:diguanylate cyclase (GGDEF)-like protein
MNSVALSPQMLNRLMPMNLVVDAQSRIALVGPTLAKALPAEVVGQEFDKIFVIRRPARVTDLKTLAQMGEDRLRLVLRAQPDMALRGTLVAAENGNMVLNLSFGIGVVDAVRRYGLTDGDFAATDLTVEMLYLVEAKSAVMAELKKLNERLHGAKIRAEEQALTDTLTGLRNRRSLETALDHLINSGTHFGLMHIDLDYFKQVNDTLGHAAGDAVLKAVALVMKRETRTADFVARVGGDEFVVLFPGLVEGTTLANVAARLINGLQEPIDFEGKSCRISASIGLTVSSIYDAPSAEQMLADADEATYASKRAGRGQANFHPSLNGDAA